MPTDKITHALAGFALYAVFCRFGWYAGLGAVVIAGAGKELYDRLHPQTHTCDWRDLLATCAGGMIALVNTLI